MDTPTRMRRFTVAEYHRLAEVGVLRPGERVELLDGAIVEMSPIGDRHAVRHAAIVGLLHDRFRPAFTIYGQASFPIGTGDEPQPDIAVAPSARARLGERLPAIAEVLAVIELAESSLRTDLGAKMRLYARARLRNYLVVDLAGDVLVRHTGPHDLGYERVETLAKGARFGFDGIPVGFDAADFLSPG